MQRSSLSPPHSHESPQHAPLLRGQASMAFIFLVIIFIIKIIIIMIIIMMIRVRVPPTRVAVLPIPSSLLVTPHPSAHLRALDRGDHDALMIVLVMIEMMMKMTMTV